MIQKKQTFLDVVGRRLGEFPDAPQTALILDPRSILEVTDTFLDATGHIWRVLVYDRDDLAFRYALSQENRHETRLAVVVRGREGKDSNDYFIDISFIPDIVDEAAEIIDCSPSGLLATLVTDSLPAELYEEPLLSLWSGRLDIFVEPLFKYRKFTGKSYVLNRFDVMKVALATSCPSVVLEALAELSDEISPRIAAYLRIVLENDLSDLENFMLRTLIAGPEPDQVVQAWCAIEKPVLSRFLYLSLASQRYAVPSPVHALERLGLLEFDLSLGSDTEKVFHLLKKDLGLQNAVTKFAEENASLSSDLDKLVGSFKFGSMDQIFKSLSEERCPAVFTAISRFVARDVLKSKEGRQALARWNSSSIHLLPAEAINTPFTSRARHFLDLLFHLSWLEGTLEQIPDPPDSLLELITVYRDAELHLFDLMDAETLDLMRLLKEPATLEWTKGYVEQQRSRYQAILEAYDKKLAELITGDFQKYIHFPQLNIQLLRDLIQAGVRLKERVWIIILDGMRLDSWDRWIWPKLQEHFEVDGQEKLYLTTLPSYTDISRVSLLAGKLPPYWKDYFNHPTSDHNILLSRYLGLNKDESKKLLKVVARAEEKVEQAELDFEAAQYRTMIFNISDTWIHSEQGSLVRVNEIVREKFEKMVLSEILHKITPDDIVVVTSDHGFVELKKQNGQVVDETKLDKAVPLEDITYRYIRGAFYETGVKFAYEDKSRWTLTVGSQWFDRPKAGGKKARYSHGGISLAEMVVPGVRLRRRSEKKAGVILTVEPPAEAAAGDQVAISVRMKNDGTTSVKVELSARVAGRLVAQDVVVLPAGVAYPWSFSVTADPKLSQVSINAQYSFGKERKSETRHVAIPVKEIGTKVEIDTSALDVFDDM